MALSQLLVSGVPKSRLSVLWPQAETASLGPPLASGSQHGMRREWTVPDQATLAPSGAGEAY